VELQEPRHIGTVAAFRFGRDGRYVLYRQLQQQLSEAGNQQNEKRRLLAVMHGLEVVPGKVPVRIPATHPLPQGLAISDMVPSGAASTTAGNRREQFDFDKAAENCFPVSPRARPRTRRRWCTMPAT
jgi:hypothetical protein